MKAFHWGINSSRFTLKKTLVAVLSVVLLLFVLCGCGGENETTGSKITAPSVTPYAVHLSFTNSAATGITISWLLEEDIPSYLEYYPLAAGSFQTAVSVKTETEAVFERQAMFCVAQLSGLEPATTYAYHVGNTDYWTETATFTTAADGEFTFIYLGDSQREIDGDPGYATFNRVLQSVKNRGGSSFLMMGGDLINNSDNFSEWQDFFEAGRKVFAELPLLPAMGNHDNTQGYLDVFDLPKNGPQGSEERFYSFDYNDAHFTVLDCNTLLTEDNLNWLKNDLAATDKKWKIAMTHYPVYIALQSGRDGTRAAALQEQLAPILEQAGVDLVLVGHQHCYMRTYPMSQGKPAEDGRGVTYLMGLSGNKFYASDGNTAEYKAFELFEVPVYTYITVKSDCLAIETRGLFSGVVDSFEIVK